MHAYTYSCLMHACLKAHLSRDETAFAECELQRSSDAFENNPKALNGRVDLQKVEPSSADRVYY